MRQIRGIEVQKGKIMATITVVNACSTTTCAYNNEGCRAFAITIGGSSEKATCGTFIALDARGGLQVADGHVGACQRLECRHNSDLMCTADMIAVGDIANCTSYEIR